MDEAYGRSKSLRVWPEEHDQPHVVAARCNDDVVTTAMGQARVDELIASLPRNASASHFLGFLRLACALICYRRADRINLLTSNSPN